MNPIFSLIFLRRRETQSPAQPPPQLSPPSFPLLRLSTSSLPHPYRFGCRPLRCLPFLAPDPELPLALPSPGLFSPPPPRGWQARTAPRRRPPPPASAELQPTRVPRSSKLPLCVPTPFPARSPPLLSPLCPRTLFAILCYLVTNLHFPQVWSLAFAPLLSSESFQIPKLLF